MSIIFESLFTFPLSEQLILDGQWEDCLEFIQPLAQLSTFDYPMFQYLILKHK